MVKPSGLGAYDLRALRTSSSLNGSSSSSLSSILKVEMFSNSADGLHGLVSDFKLSVSLLLYFPCVQQFVQGIPALPEPYSSDSLVCHRPLYSIYRYLFSGHTDETPRDYQCNLGPDGRRRDADERPELCRGTVEFVATKEYMVRDPMPAVYFFLIDVSMNAIQTGATAAACSAISQVISDLPDGPRTLVGVATFDSTIHFYNLKCALQQPLMLIVPDVQDVYTPLQTDVIVQLSECRQNLELLLESIPTMFQNNWTANSAFGAAVKAAFLAMKSTGGKLLVFQSALMSYAEKTNHDIAYSEELYIFQFQEANKLLQPADKNLKTMAIEFAEYQVCVDVFLTTQSYEDIASISVIPRTTGGQVYYYFPFSALADTAKLYNDLRWNITRPERFEAVMRVRCSQGIQVQEYAGNYCKRIPTDVDLPACGFLHHPEFGPVLLVSFGGVDDATEKKHVL
ncbi:Protein transport protein-like [Capsicum annuum]|uniref:Protein transport protein-like n=1 Tax=Capsicum annuum TaxID=4072 RepID=A0A2G2ZEQ8_CAPAN|nr:Protein transport protein-like [Capsicum annuum]